MTDVAEPHHEPATRAPRTVLIAAAIAVIQSLAVIAVGIALALRDIRGVVNNSVVSDTSAAAHIGLGTAIFIFIVFGFVIAGSIGMIRGARWGRGAVVLVEFILAASAFQMMSGGALSLGLVTLASAATVLILVLLAKPSQQWFELNW